MKTCNKSANCCYGNCYKPNTCAYNEDMNEYDLCPIIAENWDEMIDRISGGRKSDDKMQRLRFWTDK